MCLEVSSVMGISFYIIVFHTPTTSFFSLSFSENSLILVRIFPHLDSNWEETTVCGSGTGHCHGHVPEPELLKMQNIGQFPDELVKIEDGQCH